MTHFHEEQFAYMAMAASNKPEFFGAFLQELQGPGRMFDQLCAKQIVRLQQDDAALTELVLSSVPATQRLLASTCFDAKRWAVLRALFPQVRSRIGDDAAASMLHACDSKTVATALDDKVFVQNKNIKWHRLATFHGPVLVAIIKAQLQDDKVLWSRQSVWQTWVVRLTVGDACRTFFTGPCQGDLLKLAVEYPVLSWRDASRSAPQV